MRTGPSKAIKFKTSTKCSYLEIVIVNSQSIRHSINANAYDDMNQEGQ